MSLLFAAFTIAMSSISIEVMDYPYSDDPVYLIWEETDSGCMISLAAHPDGTPMVEFVLYPGIFNSAKVYAVFDEPERILSVYSQYPFTANYYLATYRLDDDGSLSLLEGVDHDSYFEALQEIEFSVDSLSFQEVMQSAWSVMYPHANPYYREMCIIVLSAGVHNARNLLDAGEPVDSVLAVFQEIDFLAWNLSGQEKAHLVVSDLADYPAGLEISSMEYLEILSEYADILQELGATEDSESVRLVQWELSGQ